MLDKEKMLRFAKSSEDKLLISKWIDKVVATERKGFTSYSDFLDPRQQMLFQNMKEALPVQTVLYGGYPSAERKMAAFFEQLPSMETFPLSVLAIHGREIHELSHRDFLGALMGLGIKREKIGDILIGDPVLIIVSDDIAEYLLLHLSKIGKHSIEIDRYTGVPEAPLKTTKEIRDTVQSLRLDAVCAAAFGISRTQAVKLIQQQRVFVNYEVNDHISCLLKGGEVLSIKGYGKAELEQIVGKSRKDRYIIAIRKYI